MPCVRARTAIFVFYVNNMEKKKIDNLQWRDGRRFHDVLVSSDILEKVVYIVYQFVATVQFWVRFSPLRLKQLVTSRTWGEYLNKHKTQGHEAQHCGRNLPPIGAVTKICFADYTGYILTRKVPFRIIAYCVHWILVRTSPLFDMVAVTCRTEMTEVHLSDMYFDIYLSQITKYARDLQKQKYLY
jgi:hypothetical protein